MLLIIVPCYLQYVIIDVKLNINIYYVPCIFMLFGFGCINVFYWFSYFIFNVDLGFVDISFNEISNMRL